MMSAAATSPELQPIRQLCAGVVSYRTDGWRRLIFMPGLRLLAAGVQKTMDAVLCLNHDNPAYPTKLYLAERLGSGLNWNEEAHLLGRQWYTFSWRNVSSDRAPIEILAAHLAPLSRGQAT